MVEAPAGAVAAAPAALLGLLFLVSAWWDSAFDLRYWALLAILALALLLVQVLTGTLAVPSRGPLVVATAAFWCFAAYVLLTAAWSQSAGAAWEEGARSLLYAAVWTQGVSCVTDRRWRARLGAALTAGVAAIALITLIGLLTKDTGLFLAGRLDSPVGYRNGTAALFALAVWPLIGIAARRGISSALRATALAAAVLDLSLVLLTQSRGVVLALVLGGVVHFAIGPDRLRRAWLALGAAGIVAALSSSLLTPYDAFVDTGAAIHSGDIGTAATAALAATAIAFAAGLFLCIFDNGLRSQSLGRGMRVVGGIALVLVLLAIGGAGLARIGDPVSYAGDKIEEFKDTEAASTGSTRLGSVGGQRSDLWRVALNEFQDHPVAGAGAGSWEFAYYRERRTDRNLSDPHSLPLRLLGDTGLIGALLLAVWLAAAGVAIAGRAREAFQSDRLWIGGLAAAGVTVLGQCLVDWLWLLPGLLGLGFLSLGIAAAEPTEAASRAPGRLPTRLVLAVAIAAATASVGLLFLSDLYVRKARVEAFNSPAAELSAARTAAKLDPVAVSPHFLEASALESEGRRAAAREALNEALDLEPDNFVTLGLLGDFEERGGNSSAARGYYREALLLNPRDTGLRKLAEGRGRPR